jgi:hypothetical protein
LDANVRQGINDERRGGITVGVRPEAGGYACLKNDITRGLHANAVIDGRATEDYEFLDPCGRTLFSQGSVIVGALETVELDGGLVGRVAEEGGVRVEDSCIELDRAQGGCNHITHVDERRIGANLEGVHNERADIALCRSDIGNRYGAHKRDRRTQKVG